MNIGIDISPIMYSRGVSHYTSNLVTALHKQKGHQLFLYGSSFRQHETLLNFSKKLNLSHQTKIQKYPPSLLNKMWQVGLNPIWKLLPSINVFHSWDWLQPPDKNLPLVSTIHDLAMLKFPETAHPKLLKMHQRSWKILKDRQAHIIAVSRATRKDIIELLDFPPERIHVVYEALPQEAVDAAEQLSETDYEIIKNRLHLDQPYLLCVGTREPRKNLQRVIEAWQPLAKEYQLIVAGAAGWDQTTHAGVKFLGQVTGQELAVLYEEAAVFVYPSLYEGFGLPILEAFYHGTPVVTANTSAMPEVAGNAAELVNPLSSEDIRRGITLVLNESNHDQQLRLQRMMLRLQLFDWQKVAEQTIAVYQQTVV